MTTVDHPSVEALRRRLDEEDEALRRRWGRQEPAPAPTEPSLAEDEQTPIAGELVAEEIEP